MAPQPRRRGSSCMSRRVRRPPRGAAVVFAALLVASGAHAPSQPAAVAPVPPTTASTSEKLEPALMLTFTSGDATDARRARLVTLHVPAGASPTPFVPAGPFKATWTGNITLRVRGEYTFAAAGRGQLKVTVNDNVALDVTGDDLAAASEKAEKVKLVRGKNKLIVEYTSRAEGDATVRLNWCEKTYQPETMVLTILCY